MGTTEKPRRPGPERLEAALRGEDEVRVRELLADVHPADLATWMQDLQEEDVWRVWSLLDARQRAELLQNAGDALRTDLLLRLMPGEIADVVELLPANEVVDLLSMVDAQTTEQVLRSVDYERAEGLRELLHYPEDSAGGLMTTEYLAVVSGTRVGDAIKEIKNEEGPAAQQSDGVFVIDPAGRPLGYVSDRDLLTHNIHTSVDEAMAIDLVTVGVDEDQEEVAHLIQKYDLSALPVVDPSGALLGVVTADEVRDVLEEEAEEDIRLVVGTSPEEQTRMPVLARVRHRMPLQALTVVGGLATARILGFALPNAAGGSEADVLRYVPIIVGLAGNVGIQSSTILVRAFATGEVQPDREASVLGAEVRVGLVIGLVCGLVTGLVAALLEGGVDPAWRFGSALGAAILAAVTWASFLGCAVPLVCKRFGIDPAVVAGPFLITLSDVSGASIFVGVAHVLIGLAE